MSSEQHDVETVEWTHAQPYVALSASGRSHAVDPVAYLRGRDGFAVTYCGRTASVEHGRREQPLIVVGQYDVDCLSCRRRIEQQGAGA
jgi:hypothetical protein